jgi:hypothetical protein
MKFVLFSNKIMYRITLRIMCVFVSYTRISSACLGRNMFFTEEVLARTNRLLSFDTTRTA